MFPNVYIVEATSTVAWSIKLNNCLISFLKSWILSYFYHPQNKTMLFLYPLHNSFMRSWELWHCGMALLCLQSVKRSKFWDHTPNCTAKVSKSSNSNWCRNCGLDTRLNVCGGNMCGGHVSSKMVIATCFNNFQCETFAKTVKKGSLFQLCIEQSCLIFFCMCFPQKSQG